MNTADLLQAKELVETAEDIVHLKAEMSQPEFRRSVRKEMRKAIARQVHKMQAETAEKEVAELVEGVLVKQIQDMAQRLMGLEEKGYATKSHSDAAHTLVSQVADTKTVKVALIDRLLPLMAVKMAEAAVSQMVQIGVDPRRQKSTNNSGTRKSAETEVEQEESKEMVSGIKSHDTGSLVPYQQQPPQIDISMPHSLNIKIPNQPAPNVEVRVPNQPAPNVEVKVPDQPAPNVEVIMPHQPVPNVTMSPITINLPEIHPPPINVYNSIERIKLEMPEQQPPVVNVQVPETKVESSVNIPKDAIKVEVNMPKEKEEKKPKKATIRHHDGSVSEIILE